MRIRTQNHLETAFAAEYQAVEKLVKDAYKNGYYRTCYEFQRGLGVGFDVAGIDERTLDMLAKKPWTVDRRTFSDRIWERKDKMVSALHQEMIRNCIYGRSRKEMTAALEQFVRKDIKNAEFCAARVIKTETAFFTSQSQRQALSDLDCEMYEVYLPLSSNSCEVCREMNGKRFKLSEYVVGSTAPPFHPNCENGSIIPYYEDGLFDKSEGGEKIPDDITYPEWEKKFVKDDLGLTNGDNGGIIKREDMPRKNRGGSYSVDWKAIQSTDYSDKFKSLSDDQKVVDAVLVRAKWALNNRDGLKTEEIYAISLNSAKEIARVTNQNFDFAIQRSESFIRALNEADAAGDKILLLHNHPRGLPPSISDINALLRNRNVSGITVGHDGSVYHYTRPSKEISEFDFNVKLRHFKEFDEITNMEKALEALQEEFGFTITKL